MPIWRNRGFARASEGSASSWLNKIVRAIKRAGVLRSIGLIAAVIAIIAFFMELNYRHEERTARAWQLLTIKAAGNSGKIEALEYLNLKSPLFRFWPFWPFKDRVSLRGIDLTPPVLDEWWKGRSIQKRVLWGDCPQFVYLRGVNLADACLIDAVLVCADLQNADLQRADLRQADLQGAYLLGADLQEAEFGVLPEDNPQRTTKLRFAFLHKADLRKVKGLDCDQLQKATLNEKGEGWNSACRDEHLACGEALPPIPDPDKPCREQPNP